MKGTRVTPEQWRRIVELYQGGEVEMTAIAIRFGVTHQTIRLGLRQRLPYLRGRCHRQQLKENPACGNSASPV
jgi:transposase-like protein